MSWAEVKKAINNDVTKPLNVKISELIQDFKSLFEVGKRKFSFLTQSSTNRGSIFAAQNVSSQTTIESSFQFTPAYSGYIRVHYSAIATYSSSYSCALYIGDESNTNLYYKDVLINTTEDNGYFDFQVEKGVTYRFRYANGYRKNSTITAYLGYDISEENRITIASVRTVQRGTFSFSSNNTSVKITLNGFVNPDKMSVLIFGGNSIYYGDNYGLRGAAYVKSLSNKYLVLTIGQYTTSDSIYIDGSYEVVEYY